MVPLSPTARKVLAALPGQPGNPWAISGSAPGNRLGNLNASWGIVRKKAGLEDVWLHDLRHSFASGGLLVGEGLPMIGKLLGHNKVQTTAGYAHLADGHLVETAEKIGSLSPLSPGISSRTRTALSMTSGRPCP